MHATDGLASRPSRPPQLFITTSSLTHTPLYQGVYLALLQLGVMTVQSIKLKILKIHFQRILVALFFLFATQISFAHLLSAGHASLNLIENKAILLIAVPVSVFQNIDSNQDGLLQPEEIRTQRTQIIAQLNQLVDIQIGGVQGQMLDDQIMVSMHVDSQNSTPQIEWFHQLQFDKLLATDMVEIKLSASLLEKSDFIVQVTRSGEKELGYFKPSADTHIFFKNGWRTFQAFFIEGWLHILLGFDHLVFIMALLAAKFSIRRWAWVLTSFTLAHGLTYALATFGVVQIKPEFIEPLIALSILLTATLSLFKIEPRLLLEILAVFGIGLIHGLGFASSMSMQLNDVRFPMSSIIGFNLGVEAGQVAIALIFGAFLLTFKSKPDWLERVQRSMIWLSFLAGAFWFFERIQG
jgi:hydrogenase/urease accessory protein HupE